MCTAVTRPNLSRRSWLSTPMSGSTTPYLSSWLNQVENWFARIQRDLISRCVFTSVKAIDKQLMRYIRHYNKVPKPLKWKYGDPQRRHHQFFWISGLAPSRKSTSPRKNGAAAAGDRTRAVLDACGHFNPGVHAFFVHRERGCGKGGVCERPDGNGDAVFATLARVVHRGTACGAEAERALASGVTHPNERVRSSGNDHRACGKSRLCSEHAARSALAVQAVANGDANRVGRGDSCELAARATGRSGRHLEAYVSRGQIGLPQRLRSTASSPLPRRPSMSSSARSLDGVYTSNFNASVD